MNKCLVISVSTLYTAPTREYKVASSPADFSVVGADLECIIADFCALGADLKGIIADFCALGADLEYITADFCALGADLEGIIADYCALGADLEYINRLQLQKTQKIPYYTLSNRSIVRDNL